MSSVVYVLGSNLYINLTNKCPCDCDFCVRKGEEGVGSADSLWLTSEPSAEDVIAELKEIKLDDYGEIVFCGYGEPLCALDTLLAVCEYLKAHTSLKIRVNTNGLGDLINEKPTPTLLKSLVDAVSVSLNASDAKRYDAICHPVFGERSYGAMLQFAKDCKAYVPKVQFSVVDVIGPEDIAACQRVADEADVPLKIRHYL